MSVNRRQIDAAAKEYKIADMRRAVGSSRGASHQHEGELMRGKANWRRAGFSGLKAARRLPLPPNVQTVRSTEHPDEPCTRLTPSRYALGLLSPKKYGCTMSMLSARGVKVGIVDELIAAGLAAASIECVGPGAIEIKRVKITEAGRRMLL
jgi:hypothetical protein